MFWTWLKYVIALLVVLTLSTGFLIGIVLGFRELFDTLGPDLFSLVILAGALLWVIGYLAYGLAQQERINRGKS